MKKRILTIVIVAAVVILGAVAFAGYIGMFGTVEVYEKEIGPYDYVYKEFRGDYKLSGPVFEEVFNILLKHGIKTELGIGIYYDDPQKIPEYDLRSDCGVIISQEEAGKIKDLNTGLKTGVMKKSRRAIVEFPIKNSLSYMVGPIQAYPALSKYARENGYKQDAPSCEIYDEKEGKILFVMDIFK